jgi:hypothetical protein
MFRGDSTGAWARSAGRPMVEVRDPYPQATTDDSFFSCRSTRCRCADQPFPAWRLALLFPAGTAAAPAGTGPLLGGSARPALKPCTVLQPPPGGYPDERHTSETCRHRSCRYRSIRHGHSPLRQLTNRPRTVGGCPKRSAGLWLPQAPSNRWAATRPVPTAAERGADPASGRVGNASPGPPRERCIAEP